MAKKSTDAEFRRRVLEVFGLRLGGAECEDLRQYASAPEQNWNVSDRQLWRYVAAADALCKDYFDAKADHLLARHLLQRRQLYARALEAGDFRAALAVLKDEAKLEGLYPPRKSEVSGPQGAPVPIDAKVTRDLKADLAPYLDVFREMLGEEASVHGSGRP